MSELLSISYAQEWPDTEVVAVTGEVDLANCEELADAIKHLNGARSIVVDMTACTFFDSSCLRVLVQGANESERMDKAFNVRVNEQGRRIIDLTGLSEKLGVESFNALSRQPSP